MTLPSYFALGATLYTPCTHPKLSRVMQQGLGSRSMVFCTEDAVLEHELEDALNNLNTSLNELVPDEVLLRFIRPRNPTVLSRILQMPCIDKIDGFVLPKADLTSMPLYREILAGVGKGFALMPTLETAEVLDPSLLPRIRDELDKVKSQIICLRIGGNDLMSLLGLKRLPGLCAYDTPLRMVIEQLVINFRPVGYELSAPVFDFIDDRTTLSTEVARDISYGMYAKTAIHPNQVTVIEEEYARFAQMNLEQAQAVTEQSASAVFKLNGQMMERTCHSSWAKRTLAVASILNERQLSAANA